MSLSCLGVNTWRGRDGGRERGGEGREKGGKEGGREGGRAEERKGGGGREGAEGGREGGREEERFIIVSTMEGFHRNPMACNTPHSSSAAHWADGRVGGEGPVL